MPSVMHITATPARNMGAVRSVWHGQDTGHIRVYVLHSTMDDAQTRLCRILPPASYHLAHIDRGHSLHGGMVCLRHALDVYALACSCTDALRSGCASNPYTPVSRHAQNRAAFGH